MTKLVVFIKIMDSCKAVFVFILFELEVINFCKAFNLGLMEMELSYSQIPLVSIYGAKVG
jgi:hypothetical protein